VRARPWHEAGIGYDHADIAIELADYREARERYLEALAAANDLGIKDTSLVEACAVFLARRDHPEVAAELLAAAETFSVRGHRSRTAGGQARYDAALADCRARLHQDVLAAA